MRNRTDAERQAQIDVDDAALTAWLMATFFDDAPDSDEWLNDYTSDDAAAEDAQAMKAAEPCS
jgi:hypothetical protein